MADFYCDHGAYATNLGATPAWATPQEGDGSATAAASASAVGSILLNAQPAATNLLTICGVTFTCVASGATGNQFNLGAAITNTVDNIVAVINGCTTAVGSTVAIGTPQLRNLVFARNTAGTTVEIMTRVGSTRLNHATNSNVAMSHSGWGTAPTFTQFIGGTGGCWGWFINNAAIGVSSSIALGQYGAWMATPYVCAAMPTMADTVWYRTGGGASKTIAISLSASLTVAHGLYDTNKRFDTNTRTGWTGDSGTGKVRIALTLTATFIEVYFPMRQINGHSSYVCDRRGNFEIELISSQNNGGLVIGQHPMVPDYLSSVRLKGVKFIDASTNSGGYFYPFGSVYAGYSGTIAMTYEDCDYSVTTSRTWIRQLFALCSSQSASGLVSHSGGTFDYNISGVADPGGLILPPAASNFASLALRGCSFLGFAAGYKLLSSLGQFQNTNTAVMQITAENCSGLIMPAAYAGLTFNHYNGDQGSRRIAHSSETSGAGQGMRVEDVRGVAEWLPAASPAFPTLTAVNVVTGAAWSMRVIWIAAAGLNPGKPYVAPDLRMKSTLTSDGTRTFTLELFLLTATVDGVEAAFTYTDLNGIARSDSTNALVSTSASWAGTGSYGSYGARKLTAASSYSVKAGCIIACSLRFTKSPTTSVEYVYFDPEFVVA